MSATILIVDDEENIREFLKATLTLENHTIIDASNGLDALKILANQSIDLLITDIFMPGMSGVELAIKIKMNYKDLKILGITGGGKMITSDQVQSMSKEFFTDFLNKPFTNDELINKVNEILENN